MKLSELSFADLEVLEARLWNAYHEATDKTRLGQTDFIPVMDNLETKLTEIKHEINTRIDKFINS